VRALRRSFCIAVAAACAAGAGLAFADPAGAEMARIERLIEAVGQNREAHFLRNGSEYSAEDAATFLRRKLEAYGSRVKTVHDFIEQIGSKSSTSGELYRVRLADGRVVPSGDFLRAELARIEAKR
jgi:hypothetical protein